VPGIPVKIKSFALKWGQPEKPFPGASRGLCELFFMQKESAHMFSLAAFHKDDLAGRSQIYGQNGYIWHWYSHILQ